MNEIEQAIQSYAEWCYVFADTGTDEAMDRKDQALFKLRSAIAAATFTDEERAVIRALAKWELATRARTEAYQESSRYEDWLHADIVMNNADKAVDAIPTDVLKRLAGEQ